ncbi:MAG: hypothetical protein AAF696_34745 [Bacteroidota bacterium]
MTFPEISEKDILQVLDLTIKKDEDNKLIAFLCMLSAYTENNPFNISFNAPSSSGKSYIPLEVSKLFPSEDVIKLGNCSPTAFFHEQGEYDKEKNEILIDLSRKILIFTDMPNHGLLARLRPLLSHDEKEMISKITDKQKKGGLRTKTVRLRGFPSVVFCTAKMNPDEQEATRFLMLSPEVNEVKVKAGVTSKVVREIDLDKYTDLVESNSNRKALRERIWAIREANIQEITLPHNTDLAASFLKGKRLQPRLQRDIGRVISIIKTFALLNLWQRERNGSGLIATKADVDAGLALWKRICPAQELNLPPYVYNTFMKVIRPRYVELNEAQNPRPFQSRSEGKKTRRT